MYIDGVEMEKEVELRKPNLKVGDHVEVRYTTDKNGEIKMFNDGAHSWLKQMAIGYTAGIIFSVIIIILKYTGIMD